MSIGSKPLKMVICGKCGAKNFINGELAPMETVACFQCRHPVMLTVKMAHFELRAVIGSGGMGTVYRAFDLNLQREVAIKLIKKEMTSDAKAMTQFYREARTGASINHTNIIHVYHFDIFDGRPYLVMEVADNGSLDSRIEKEKRVPELAVLDVGIKIADALKNALTNNNLLHRDIKPGNILYNASGEPKLIDFGLASAAEESDGEIWGTPYYIAPEKIRGGKEGFHSDMYSLGATLYHAVTGQVPFEAPTTNEILAAHVDTPITPPNHIANEVTEDTSDAIVCAMAKTHEERYPTYDHFIMAFEAARSKLLVQKYRPSDSNEGAPARSWWKG